MEENLYTTNFVIPSFCQNVTFIGASSSLNSFSLSLSLTHIASIFLWKSLLLYDAALLLYCRCRLSSHLVGCLCTFILFVHCMLLTKLFYSHFHSISPHLRVHCDCVIVFACVRVYLVRNLLIYMIRCLHTHTHTYIYIYISKPISTRSHCWTAMFYTV